MAKKNQKPNPEYDSQRETRVLLEQIRTEVKLVAEQHGSIKGDIGSIIKKLDEHDGRFNRLEMAAMDNTREARQLQSGQERIEKKLDTAIGDHETRIHRLEAKVGA